MIWCSIVEWTESNLSESTFVCLNHTTQYTHSLQYFLFRLRPNIFLVLIGIMTWYQPFRYRAIRRLGDTAPAVPSSRWWMLGNLLALIRDYIDVLLFIFSRHWSKMCRYYLLRCTFCFHDIFRHKNGNSCLDFVRLLKVNYLCVNLQVILPVISTGNFIWSRGLKPQKCVLLSVRLYVRLQRTYASTEDMWFYHYISVGLN